MKSSTSRALPIRVLHLRDSPWVDGPGRTIVETAARIDRSRVDYHVGVLVPDPAGQHPLVMALRSRNLPVHVVPDGRGISHETLRHIVGLIDFLQIDVLHASEFRSNVLALLCRRERPVKLVSTAHGWIANNLRGRLYSLLDRALLRSFDRVIFVSHATRKHLPSWYLPDSRVRVIRNALMTESYGSGTSIRARSHIGPTDTVRLLNVGRLSPEKGQSQLLRAVAEVANDVPFVRLDIAGTGPLDNEIARLAASLGIGRNVKLLGYVEDMPKLYASADVVVQSSTTEGLPNVILEAAFLGVPVIATDVGGTREVIQHGESGWLVKPNSMEALVDGLRHYIASPDAHWRMAAAGRSRIQGEFTFAARTEAQTRVYEELT